MVHFDIGLEIIASFIILYVLATSWGIGPRPCLPFIAVVAALCIKGGIREPSFSIR